MSKSIKIILHNIYPKITLLLLSFGGTYAFTRILKEIFKRARPENIFYGPESFSFPSSHASVSTALFISILILALPYFTKGLYRTFLYVLCIMFPIVIGISRVFLGVHWITDVIGGWILGILSVYLFYYLVSVFYGHGWNSSEQTHNTD